MKISKLTIENFKSIKSLQDFELKDINVLIGANGSGKSNFISFFQLLNNIIEESLQNYVRENAGANTLLYYGRKVSKEIIANLHIDRNQYFFQLKPTADDNFYFANEIMTFKTDRGGLYTETIEGQGYKETKIPERVGNNKNKRVAGYVEEALKRLRVYHFHDTSPEAGIKQTGNIHDALYLRPNASNLAAFLYTMQKARPEYYKQIEQTIQLAAPFFDKFILKPQDENKETILLRWKEVGSDQYFNANQLSDGTLRMICLITLFLQPELPSTIIIDEPELGLHPYAIEVLCALIRSASLKSQIIISTQSVTLLNHFAPEEIIVVDREKEDSHFKSTFRRHTEAELAHWLEEYTIGELWEKNVIGGRP